MANDLRDISLDEIYDFIENGVATEEKSDTVLYMLEMDKVRGMYLRLDKFPSKDHIIAHLIKVDGYSRYFATKLYNQAMEYFYCDTTISKAAWRNIYAEKMEKVIAFAIQTMKDASDASKVAKMIFDMGKLRQLDQPDMEDLPSELFDRPFKLYTMNPEDVGIPKADRREIATFIDGLPELTELERDLIKREAGILPNKVFLDKIEDPRYEESEER
jgi:hypothetical protein